MIIRKVSVLIVDSYSTHHALDDFDVLKLHDEHDHSIGHQTIDESLPLDEGIDLNR